MRYLLATFSSAILIGSMFFLHIVVSSKMKGWANTGKTLSVIEQILVEASQTIGQYWYFVAPAIVFGCFFIAILWPSSDSSGQK